MSVGKRSTKSLKPFVSKPSDVRAISTRLSNPASSSPPFAPRPSLQCQARIMVTLKSPVTSSDRSRNESPHSGQIPRASSPGLGHLGHFVRHGVGVLRAPLACSFLAFFSAASKALEASAIAKTRGVSPCWSFSPGSTPCSSSREMSKCTNCSSLKSSLQRSLASGEVNAWSALHVGSAFALAHFLRRCSRMFSRRQWRRHTIAFTQLLPSPSSSEATLQATSSQSLQFCRVASASLPSSGAQRSTRSASSAKLLPTASAFRLRRFCECAMTAFLGGARGARRRLPGNRFEEAPLSLPLPWS
mmetsp:Transcript_43828/g.95382  ORF Transcript_43828/g.95382 Transcript_43828/m.95382 type:complete len:302 (+) Transcript_43828:395-1300(+)